MKIFWKISKKATIYATNALNSFAKGTFLCAGTAFREHKLGLEEWEGFREVGKAFQAGQTA